jgi:serine/threonine protein kinase
MEKVLPEGKIPRYLIDKISNDEIYQKYFYKSELNWPKIAKNDDSVKYVNLLIGLEESLQTHKSYDHLLFFDLLKNCLKYNPKDRILPIDALNHPFLKL